MMSEKVVLVTVTYGKREEFVRELLRRCFLEHGLYSAIVVNNGSSCDLDFSQDSFGAQVKRVDVGYNSGSATGYAVGLREALSTDADYIWMMDDDNAPAANCLTRLLTRLKTPDVCPENLRAVLALRVDHQPDIAQGLSSARAYPPRSSYLGFHFKRIPYKIWRRVPWFSRKPKRESTEFEIVPYAPYGGLLASAELFKKIGFPREEFVLYADDTEYTFRITKLGGKIELVRDAVAEDLEESWGIKKKVNNAFHGFLTKGSDFQIYYGVRNLVWFDINVWKTSNWQYNLNRKIYLAILKNFAEKYKARARYLLIVRAISDAENNKMGLNKDWVL